MEGGRGGRGDTEIEEWGGGREFELELENFILQGL